MAESAVLVVEELKCSICLDNFNNPKVLPCCHSFCLHCLEGAHERTKDKKSLTCPQCKAQHQVPTNGPRGFPDDYTLANQKQATTTASVCEQCDDSNKPVAYCHTCSDYLCDECLRAHKRVKAIRRDHKTVNITPGKDIKPQSRKSYLCSVHPEKTLELYCKSCKSLACLLCFVGLHNGHDIGSIDSKTRQEAEQSINNLMKATNSNLKEFNNSFKYVSVIEKEKTEAPILLKAQVDKKVDFSIQQLEARRKELHKEIDDVCTKDLKELWAQKEYHETAITSMEGALSFARRALACKEDTELLALCAQVTSRLKELSQLKWNSQSTMKIEMTTVEFNQPQSKETDTTDTAVGELKTDILNVQITTEKLPNRVKLHNVEPCGVTCIFQVTAVMNYKWKRNTPKLTASATYSSQNDDYDEKMSITKKNATANSWTVEFDPGEADTYTITLRVNGYYGGTYSSEYRIEVYDEPAITTFSRRRAMRMPIHT